MKSAVTQSTTSFRDQLIMLKIFFWIRNINKLDRLIRIVRDRDEYRARKQFVKSVNPLATNDDAIERLEKSGITTFKPSEQVSSELVKACLARLDQTDQDDMSTQEHKTFYLNSLTDSDYDPLSPFMRYALDENALWTVAGYLGCAPYVQSIELIYSIPRKDGEDMYRTHLFHKDKIDRRIVKLFTYITDVGEENGPLTLLPREATAKVPWYVEIPHYVKDEVISKYVSLSETEQFTGASGSAVMADVKNLFHYGSRCESPRLTFVVHYNSGYAYFPRNTRHKEQLKKSGSAYTLTDIQKLALGLSLSSTE